MSKQIPAFWYNWLIVVTIGVIIFSLSLILVPNTMRQLFTQLYLPADETDQFSQTANEFVNFVYGVLGAVMTGWAVMMLFTINGAFRRGEASGWQSLALSMLIWFALDCVFSIAVGFPENALFNLGFFIMYAIPLGATYRHFTPQPR